MHHVATRAPARPSNSRRAVAALAAVGLLVGLLTVLTPAPAGAAAITSTTVADDEIAPGGSTEVTLSLTGETVTEATPTDIMLVLDESGSMSNAQFAQMKVFANDLVTELDDAGLFGNGGRMGLAMFSTTSRLVQSLTTSKSQISFAITNVSQLSGWTCIGCGLQEARQQLAPGVKPEGRNLMTILLTDGANNRGTQGQTGTTQVAQDLAQQVTLSEAAGIERFAIGVGAYVLSQLQEIASLPTNDHVFTVADFDDLAGIVGGIVASVNRPTATGVVITPTAAEGFSISDPVASAGDVTTTANGVQWELASVGAETVTLSYTLTRDAGAGCGTFAVHDEIGYADNEDNPTEFPLGSVDVIGCPPILTGVPGDIVLEATGPDGATVTYDAPTGTDAFDGTEVPVICEPESGSTFGLGSTTVTCTATDSSDRETAGTFDVTVEDTTPPELDGLDDVTVRTSNPAGVAVTYVQPTAVDLVDGSVTVSCTPPSGSTFAVGTTSVVCTAQDTEGNGTSGSFEVTVELKTIAELFEELVALVDGKGSGNSLSASALSAQASFLKGNTTPSCNQLQALLAKVSAQAPAQLGDADADDIAALTQEIRDLLGC
jgi:Mg-chelatase subunit ChlD